MRKIQVGDLLSVKYVSRVTKYPGHPSINDCYFYVDKDELLIAVADEFVYRHKMMGDRDLEEPYVKVLTRDQQVYFANPRCLIRVTSQETSSKMVEQEHK